MPPAIFYDAVTPANIPRGAYACLYMDGRYRASPVQALRFAKTRWITVLGGAAAAADAGCADFEEGNSVFSTPGALRAWALERKAMNCRARIYCDRANLFRAWEEVGGLPNVVWWISTLDDNPRWTAAELAAEAAARGVRLNVDEFWAVQYAGGEHAAYDTSRLYGVW